MGNYKLSQRADEDFASIYIYGVLEFGLARAESYTGKLQERFEQLADQPLLYPAVDHVRPGYRLSVCGSQAIYYRADEDGVIIIRILHGQEVGAALMEGR